MLLSELPWIAEARSHIGLREVKGLQHNPTILRWLERMPKFDGAAKAWWADDETPWCGLFIGYCLGVTGRHVVREWYRAKAWESPELTRLDMPAYGCLVTFTRSGGGHVGFVVGRDQRGNLMVLGGNQGDAVNIRPFARSRVTGYYWPSSSDGTRSRPLKGRYVLPELNSNGEVSTNEA